MLSDQRCDELAADLTTSREELATARLQLEDLAEELADARRELRDLRERARAVAAGLEEQLVAPSLTDRVQNRVRGAIGRDDAEAAAARLLRSSDLFDGSWYLLEHPEVVATGLDPVRHYLRHGAGLAWDPSPGFSTSGFLEAHPDVAATGENALVAHLRQARASRAGRQGRARTGPS